MPIVASYRTKCDRCGYLRLQYGATEHDAVANAVKAGWSAYPLLCLVCRRADTRTLATTCTSAPGGGDTAGPARTEHAMAKYVETTHPQKTVGAYLKVIKALNELNDLGESVGIFWTHQGDALTGITGSIVQDQATGEWRFVQA